MYDRPLPPSLILTTYQKGKDVLPGPIGTPLGNWNFISPKRTPAISGYEVSNEGIEINKFESPTMVPLNSILSEKAITVFASSFKLSIQNYSLDLPSTNYNIEIPKNSEGLIILNSKYDSYWMLRDSTGREIPNKHHLDEWNIWPIYEDMIPPFKVQYEANNFVTSSILITFISFPFLYILILRRNFN